MKASERLRELDELIRNGVPDDAEPALWSLKPVLPLIADVVEAAERAQGPLAQGRRAMTELVWTQMDFGADEKLRDALTALTAALQPERADASETPFEQPRMQQIGKSSPPPPEGATAPGIGKPRHSGGPYNDEGIPL